MSSRAWKACMAATAAILTMAVASATDERGRLPSLFGLTIGQRYSVPGRVLTKHEERNFFIYGFESRNVNYMFQGIEVSKISETVVGITGTAFHKSGGACESQLEEILAQLKEQYPGLQHKPTRQSDAVFHLLSRDRPGCFVGTDTGGQPLTYPCSISFLVYCAASGSAYKLNIRASDSEYAEKARTEARTLASRSRRKHLD